MNVALCLTWIILMLSGMLAGLRPSAVAEEPDRSAPNAQAYEEALQTAQQTRRAHAALERELYDAQRERFELNQSAEDKQRLAESRAKVEADFARAAQLVGDRETSARHKINTIEASREHNYAYWQSKAGACGAFADEFPYSSKGKEILLNAYLSHLMLGRFLQHETLRERLQVPALDKPLELAAFHQLQGLYYLSEYNARYPAKGTNGGATSIRFREEVTRLYQLNPSEDQVSEIHARYGIIYDERPGFAPHSDFLRLDYLATRENRKAYLKLLGQMQSRWPPRDAHWQFTARETLWQLCDLVQSDPRGTNFYWWLRGKREIGELP